MHNQPQEQAADDRKDEEFIDHFAKKIKEKKDLKDKNRELEDKNRELEDKNRQKDHDLKHLRSLLKQHNIEETPPNMMTHEEEKKQADEPNEEEKRLEADTI